MNNTTYKLDNTKSLKKLKLYKKEQPIILRSLAPRFKYESRILDNNCYRFDIPNGCDAYHDFRIELKSDVPNAALSTVLLEFNGLPIQQYTVNKWPIDKTSTYLDNKYITSYNLGFPFTRENPMGNLVYVQKFVYIDCTSNCEPSLHWNDSCIDNVELVNNTYTRSITIYREKPINSLPITILKDHTNKIKHKIQGFGIHSSILLDKVIKSITISTLNSYSILEHLKSTEHIPGNIFWYDNCNLDLTLDDLFIDLELIDKNQDLSIFTFICTYHNVLILDNGSIDLLYPHKIIHLQ
jgi:hypothetical protein